jgi:hypothetical protein
MYCIFALKLAQACDKQPEHQTPRGKIRLRSFFTQNKLRLLQLIPATVYGVIAVPISTLASFIFHD